MDQTSMPRRKHAIHHFPLAVLVVPPLLLSATTAYVLFLSSDPNVNSLFTKCFSSGPDDDAVPPLAQFPVVGPPTCCLVSFFHAALDSRRSFVIMNEILSYVGALLTVTTLESARMCNRTNWMIRNPTASWLVFNLAGGAIVWQLAIVPAFIYHGKKLSSAPAAETDPLLSSPNIDSTEGHAHGFHRHRRVPSAELHAIPISVALGYLIPCIPFLVFASTSSILVWLFFPAYVSIIRQLVRWWVPSLQSLHPGTRSVMNLHPESSNQATFMLYFVPISWSVVSHTWLLYDILFVQDDRSPTTRAALHFIQADFTAIGVTVIYWIVVEAGWRIALLSLLVGCIAGPGTGLCVAWMAREGEMPSLRKTRGLADDGIVGSSS